MPAFPTQGIDQLYMLDYGGYGYLGCGDWGGLGFGGCQCGAFLSLASGLPPAGSNPPYTISDFLAIYPKFFGQPTILPVTLASGQNAIVIDSSVTGILPGQLAAGLGIPAATVVTAVNGANVTLSNPATASGNISASFYTAPLVPLAVMQIYLNIAYASLMQTRWRESWTLVMALYIAHYLTLWLETEGNPQSTAAQIVANSLQAGITISQSADGVAQGLQALQALNNWAGWSLTQYGSQLATLARVIGAGMIYVRG